MRATPTASLLDTSIKVISESAGGAHTSSSSSIASITDKFTATGILFGFDGYGTDLTDNDTYVVYDQADFLALSAEL